MKVKKTYRLEQETINELEKLCADSGKSATEVIEGAIHDAIRLPDTERAGEGWAQTVDYRKLYEKLVGEAEELGFDREFVDWEVSICDWRADPVAVALHEWIVDNDQAEVAAKAKSQIEWEMRIVGTASERRRERAVASWRKKAAHADDPLLTLGLSNAVRSAENEAMIAEVPDIAI